MKLKGKSVFSFHIIFVFFSSLTSGQLVWEILDRKWVAGLVFCKIFKFLQTFSLTSSNYMILALAVERHRAVTRPLSVSTSPYRSVVEGGEIY